MNISNDNEHKRGHLFVVSGPSGVGKDTVLLEVRKHIPSLIKCVTATTRNPRQGEVDGKDYHFLSKSDFKKMISENGFLEYALVHGNLYGTPKSWVEEQISYGKDVILNIDVQGGIAIKKQMQSAVLVFIVPPSFEVLEKRLRSRNTDSAEQIEKRLSNALKELDEAKNYDFVIENDSLEKAAEDLKAVIVAQR